MFYWGWDGGGDLMTGSVQSLRSTSSEAASTPDSWLGCTGVQSSQLFGSIIVAATAEMQASLLPLAN